MPIAHQYLHLIECKEIDVYRDINKVFKKVNEQGYEPIKQQRMLVEYLLREFEGMYKWERNSKGDILIPRKYLQRGQF